MLWLRQWKMPSPFHCIVFDAYLFFSKLPKFATFPRRNKAEFPRFSTEIQFNYIFYLRKYRHLPDISQITA